MTDIDTWVRELDAMIANAGVAAERVRGTGHPPKPKQED